MQKTEQVGLLSKQRLAFHGALLQSVLNIDAQGVVSNADKGNNLSKQIAKGIAQSIGANTSAKRLPGQEMGNKFEEICTCFIKSTFLQLGHLRPGGWHIKKVGSHNRNEIAQYEQYAHLTALAAAASNNPQLAAALGNDYTIAPDVIITRDPEPDSTINNNSTLVDPTSATYTSLRKANGGLPILHASISCKWTIRSDRAQNSRTEALNLIRNRKGRLPHVVVITAEPLPSRIASIALGTGDIDCVYHFALPELIETVKEQDRLDALEMLGIMVEGKRLKDISDLPLDLAI